MQSAEKGLAVGGKKDLQSAEKGGGIPREAQFKRRYPPGGPIQEAVSPGRPNSGGGIKDPGIGIAFDIGSTTLVGCSVDLKSGKRLQTSSRPNPQARWGSDVLARVRAATTGTEGPAALLEMQGAVVGALNDIVNDLTGIDRDKGPGQVLKFTAVGNSVMEHLLLGVSPKGLSRVPYRPAFKEARRIKAQDIGIGLKAATEADLYVFPLIGGFVGGDIVAGMLALGLSPSEGKTRAGKATLLLDIGTNSEIVLSTPESNFVASAAAGPAFEGGELSCGMSAGPGAIEGVRVEDGRLKLDVIGATAPTGICGSGLMDAASVLIKEGVIEKNGRIRPPEEVETNLSTIIDEEEDGSMSISLFKGATGGIRAGGGVTEVKLTQADVRALQVAKAAIRAGVSMLLKKASMTEADIVKVYVAGAFGSHLKKDALHTIGLIDDGWVETLESVGDAALDGAVLALDDERKIEAELIASSAKYVSLSGSPHFEREFIVNMNF